MTAAIPFYRWWLCPPALMTAAILLLLSGCGPRVAPLLSDRPPPPIDPDAVMDAVPRADPLLPAGNTSPYTVNGVTYTVLDTAAGYREEGVASWYGLKFHGRPTANGERFSVYLATAAHRSLPIPSYLRVTNSENGRTLVVRVNDRGPFHPDRIIDLSYGAALKLGFAEQGTARVSLEVIDVGDVDDRRQTISGRYRRLQLGAFGNRDTAQALADRIEPMLDVPLIISVVERETGPLYRLRAGEFTSESALRAAQERLREAGLPVGQALP